ncbi:NIPSNAP family protein [Vibrio fluvialis]|nr:NIPSNAP family protein [Vibrio fluvialis]
MRCILTPLIRWPNSPYHYTHHGYFLPSEGANNIAMALFSFPSLSDYEKYRNNSVSDEHCKAAFKYAEETDCVISYERSFFRPILTE